jgi:23S rRNA (uracil1939-C5)-methyltransferase
MSDTTTELTPGQILELRTERLAFGGAAIARHEGRAVFVAYAAPNELVRAEITEVEKTFARAKVLEVLEASPDRIEPRCQHFGECGGCNYQHVTYEAQIAAKSEFVFDALTRIGKFDWPEKIVVHHAEPWNYRSRTQLKLKATAGTRPDGTRKRIDKRDRKRNAKAQAEADLLEEAKNGPQPPVVGYHYASSNQVLDIQQCPVLAPELEQGIEKIRTAITGMPRREWPYQIEGSCGHDGASYSPDLPGMRKDLVEHEVLGFRYLIEPESFFQGNRHLVHRLVEVAIDNEQGGLAFDLYAGVGLFSLPLSKRFERVISVEDERRACTLGRVNVKTNQCNNVHYLRRTTEQFLQSNKERPDLVVMDPPRLGAKPAIPMLLKLAAKRIVYVSCDPQTLARDLRSLVDGGYELESVEALDMFPQTYHVEAIAKLRLKDA